MNVKHRAIRSIAHGCYTARPMEMNECAIASIRGAGHALLCVFSSRKEIVRVVGSSHKRRKGPSLSPTYPHLQEKGRNHSDVIGRPQPSAVRPEKRLVEKQPSLNDACGAQMAGS